MPKKSRTDELLEQMGGHLSHMRADLTEVKTSQAIHIEHKKTIDRRLDTLAKTVDDHDKIHTEMKEKHYELNININKLAASCSDIGRSVESMIDMYKGQEKKSEEKFDKYGKRLATLQNALWVFLVILAIFFGERLLTVATLLTSVI